MDIQEFGAIIAKQRIASGLSQSELAQAIGVSRATINYLENGTSDVAFSTVLAACDLLAIPVLPAKFVPSKNLSAVEWAVRSANTSYKREMKASELVRTISTGEIERGLVPQMSYICNELSDRRLYSVVREIAAKKGIEPRQVLKNLKNIATQIQAAHPRWAHD